MRTHYAVRKNSYTKADIDFASAKTNDEHALDANYQIDLRYQIGIKNPDNSFFVTVSCVRRRRCIVSVLIRSELSDLITGFLCAANYTKTSQKNF